MTKPNTTQPKGTHGDPLGVSIILRHTANSPWVAIVPDCALKVEGPTQQECLDAMADAIETRLEFCADHGLDFFSPKAVALQEWKQLARDQMQSLEGVGPTIVAQEGSNSSTLPTIKYEVLLEDTAKQQQGHTARVTGERKDNGPPQVGG